MIKALWREEEGREGQWKPCNDFVTGRKLSSQNKFASSICKKNWGKLCLIQLSKTPPKIDYQRAVSNILQQIEAKIFSDSVQNLD